MLIPSIDLMDGKVVQLVQGEKKMLEFDSFEPWVKRFAAFPLVQLIDLDAAKGKGDNGAIVRQICQQLPCQVGGGVRSYARVAELIAAGARRVIIGSALIRDDLPDVEFGRALAEETGIERLVFAVDSRAGHVVVSGWQRSTSLRAIDLIRALEPFCFGFLYTHVDTEGTLSGFPMQIAEELTRVTARRLIVAGGIRTRQEIDALDSLGVDAVVGMAVYTGKIEV